MENHLPSILYPENTTSNLWLNKTGCVHMTLFIWTCLYTINPHVLEIIPKQIIVTREINVHDKICEEIKEN